MILPLQISFRNVKPSEVVEEWIREEAAKLDAFYGRIMSCRVIVEVPHRHHRRGAFYHVRVALVVPGAELVVKREPMLRHGIESVEDGKNVKHLEVLAPHKELRQAIDGAFKAMGRRLQDYARRQRGAVKTHEVSPRGRVSKLFPEEGYGFLETVDGREIYFHRDSVLSRGFDRLKVGAFVTFAEELGEKGPQASTVRPVGKRRVRRVAISNLA